jgi:molecular chaperone GrpE
MSQSERQELDREAVAQEAPGTRDPEAVDGKDAHADPEKRRDADADANDTESAPPDDEVPAPGGEPGHEEGMVDEVILESEWATGDPPRDEDQPPQRKKRPKKKKRKQSSEQARPGRKRPTDQEVLQRLLEKNEVILQLSKKNVETEAKLKAMADKRVQLTAEYENYRKRTRKEWDLLQDRTRAEVIVEILNVVDDFERAMAAFADQDDEFVQGVRLIYNNLLATLEKFGVRKLIALGEPFDPNYHMAVASIDSEDVESNHVVEIIQEGYLMDGDIIRPANVVIAK